METLAPTFDDDEFDGLFGMMGDAIYAKDDIYLGGGNGGVLQIIMKARQFWSNFGGCSNTASTPTSTSRYCNW